MLAVLPPGLLLAEGPDTAPSYSAASIVNSASSEPGLSPNGLVSIYGTNLSWGERAVLESDIHDDRLPTVLSGVRVYVAGILSHLYYVSPRQINFLVPANLLEGECDLWVFRQGIVGQKVRIRLLNAAPALFSQADGTLIATHADNRVITWEAPAVPGEIIVLYAAGLGQTSPRVSPGRLAELAARIQKVDDLEVLVDGEPVDRGSIYYAGLTPGSAGLYQINFRLPSHLREGSRIQIRMGEQASAALEIPASSRPPDTAATGAVSAAFNK